VQLFLGRAPLLAADLLDELALMIEPDTLDGLKTLFLNDDTLRKIALISAQTTASGVQVCRSQPLTGKDSISDRGIVFTFLGAERDLEIAVVGLRRYDCYESAHRSPNSSF
jgi:hypothetical protein